jgi:hypothetical protein
MNTYIPDRWEIVNAKLDELNLNKVLGSWYGGFANGDSWRLSSGITDIIENDNHYEIHNESGSVYICYKKSQGMSAYTAQVYLDFKEKLKEQGGIVEIIDIKDIK